MAKNTPPIVETLVELMKSYNMEHDGAEPQTIEIPKTVEVDLFELSSHVKGDLGGAIMRVGPRQALDDAGGKLYGMTIIWDADELRCGP